MGVDIIEPKVPPLEMEKVPQEGFDIVGLDIAGFNRSNVWKNIILPIKLIKSRMQARSIIKGFRPSAIVGVGGYASFPVLHAGQGMNIPTLIQEQNSFAGITNKLLAKNAKVICTAYEGMEKFQMPRSNPRVVFCKKRASVHKF